jgi:hypothetical protein
MDTKKVRWFLSLIGARLAANRSRRSFLHELEKYFAEIKELLKLEE